MRSTVSLPASKGVKRIGFFAPAEAEYVQRLAEGILRFQAERGGCVVRDFRYPHEAPDDREAWARTPRPWESWQPHGLIVNIGPDPGLPEWIGAAHIPVINTNPLCTSFPLVQPSADGVAKVALEHFESLGFEHFAFVGPEGPENPRGVALRQRLARRNIILRTCLLADVPPRWDANVELRLANDAGLQQLLREAPKPLAVLTAFDSFGRVVCLAAQNLGMKIPRDVAVLGIFNVTEARTCLPPLSSIHLPLDEVGYRAAELLTRLMAGDRIPARTDVPVHQVVARESTTMGGAEADVARAVQVIRDRAFDGVSIEQILENLNVSRSTLEREFAATLGLTPREEMSRIRIERAKQLLSTTSLPITHIAGMVGYEIAANFATFFRKQTGMTPREFRKGNGRGVSVRERALRVV